MTREQRRDVFEAIGLVAIVSSLIFLALEIRQNSDLMKAQSRTEMAQDTIALLTLNVDDKDFLDVWNRGNAGEELTALEQTQFSYTYSGWIWHWNNLAYLHRVGLYDEAEFSAQREAWRAAVFSNKANVDSWCGRRTSYSAEFMAEIDGLLTT